MGSVGKGKKKEVQANNSRRNGKRTDVNRSLEFMQPLPQVNAASNTLGYADLKALLDSDTLFLPFFNGYKRSFYLSISPLLFPLFHLCKNHVFTVTTRMNLSFIVLTFISVALSC